MLRCSIPSTSLILITVSSPAIVVRIHFHCLLPWMRKCLPMDHCSLTMESHWTLMRRSSTHSSTSQLHRWVCLLVIPYTTDHLDSNKNMLIAIIGQDMYVNFVHITFLVLKAGFMMQVLVLCCVVTRSASTCKMIWMSIAMQRSANSCVIIINQPLHASFKRDNCHSNWKNLDNYNMTAKFCSTVFLMLYFQIILVRSYFLVLFFPELLHV